jgi:DNA-binding Lrp family transcriptional regulator
MKKIRRLTDNEKELINIIGKFPETSQKELINYTKCKWVSTVVRKLEKLKEKDIVWGPYYQVDYGKLCKNPLHVLVCIIESSQSYETVISYLTIIEPKWIYPVLSQYKKLLHVGFISSNDAEMADLLKILKENNIITDYVIRTCNSKWILENPNFFGISNPPLSGLCDPCDIPDMSLGCHDTVWNECDIRILSYLQVGYRCTKLIEILREEKNMYSREWKYPQIKYARQKMVKNGLIEKKYSISPFPRNQCAHFVLFLKTRDIVATQRILCNFAAGERVFKEYTL